MKTAEADPDYRCFDEGAGMDTSARWSWPALAVWVWGGLVAAIAVYAFLMPASHTVYDMYAPAARSWWAGRDLYVKMPNDNFYRYSPLFAIALTPLAVLPDGLGGALWKAGNCAFYAFALGVFVRRLVPARPDNTRTAALFLLVLPLSLHSMYNGQANLVMLGAVLLGLTAAAEDRWNRAAAWLAVATLIKGYPLALALILMGLYPRRFAPRFAIALAVGLLLPFLTQWPAVVAAQYGSWFAHLQDSTGMMRERLRSIDHLLDTYGCPLSPGGFALLELAAGGAVFALCLRKSRRTADRRELLTETYLLFAVWVALFGPATETCTYVVMAPAIALALLEVFNRPSGWGVRLLLIASLLMMGPLVTDLFGPVVRNFANAHGSQPHGALLYLVYLLNRDGRAQQAGRSAGQAAVARRGRAA
jgi:hypothetical protein